MFPGPCRVVRVPALPGSTTRTGEFAPSRARTKERFACREEMAPSSSAAGYRVIAVEHHPHRAAQSRARDATNTNIAVLDGAGCALRVRYGALVA